MAYHLLPGFRVRVAKRPAHDHWQGGPARHTGATCPVCRRPLLLLWDLNCADTRFRVHDRPMFKYLPRLPLYYCWTCGGEMDYRVCSFDRVQVLKMSGKPHGKDFPYRRFPKYFERLPIELDGPAGMPAEARALLGTDWFTPLPAKAKRPLEKWIGHPLKYGFDIWWHQFGGLPWLVQGPERIPCPDPDCSWARRQWAMKVLATIHNDPPAGLPMVETRNEVEKRGGHFNNMVQVVFHICRNCLTIHAGNRCD